MPVAYYRTTMENWRPLLLMALARQLSCEAFRAHCGSPYCMVLVLDEGRDSPAGTERDSTDYGPEGEVHPGVPAVEVSVTPSLLPSERVESWIEREFKARTCEVFPLRGQPSDGQVVRISVGRERGQDIVVRHRTVSRHHAIIELVDDAQVSIVSANSRNPTLVNGEQLTGSKVLHSGDRLRIGAVDGAIVDYRVLWRMVRGAAQAGA